MKREELFITSKLWNTSHRPEEVEKELDETLKQLQLEYLDLYRAFLHFSPLEELSLRRYALQWCTGPSRSRLGSTRASSRRTRTGPDGLSSIPR